MDIGHSSMSIGLSTSLPTAKRDNSAPRPPDDTPTHRPKRAVGLHPCRAPARSQAGRSGSRKQAAPPTTTSPAGHGVPAGLDNEDPNSFQSPRPAPRLGPAQSCSTPTFINGQWSSCDLQRLVHSLAHGEQGQRKSINGPLPSRRRGSADGLMAMFSERLPIVGAPRV